ncbi:DNA repair protein RadA [Bdellovibrionota bacterium FG-1]
MSAKVKTHYSCQTCGYNTTKWLGRCPGCEAWNTFIEEKPQSEFRSTREAIGIPRSARDWVPLDPEDDESGEPSTGSGLVAQKRLNTGMGELDRVLGGGLIPDSFVLVGGDPGIGKSTLLLQMARGLHQKNPELKILYVSGEESIDQIRGRAHRLGVAGKGRIFLATETQLEQVFATIKELKPQVVIMDSLQTFSSGSLESAPGSVSQVREVAVKLMALAKSAGISVWLVGHVTKEGNIAGPKAVEHMVDTVLYFEAEAGATYRLLRTVKNRFGSTRELGVFEMEGEGLREVANPSSLFLGERTEPVAGVAVGVSLEGSRPLLIELQALVTPTTLAMPRRTSVGIEATRISLLAAILEKHMRLGLAEQDLFFNVAGGLKINEPACDLAAAAAIWSSYEEKAIPSGWAFIGELGLTGEVRRVAQLEERMAESKKLGFKTLVVPRSSMDRVAKLSGIRLCPISRVDEIPEIVKS